MLSLGRKKNRHMPFLDGKRRSDWLVGPKGNLLRSSAAPDRPERHFPHFAPILPMNQDGAMSLPMMNTSRYLQYLGKYFGFCDITMPGCRHGDVNGNENARHGPHWLGLQE